VETTVMTAVARPGGLFPVLAESDADGVCLVVTVWVSAP
jgi:hypothetical protein